MDTKRLEKLARKITGKNIPVVFGATPSKTNGETVWVFDPHLRWPDLPERAKKEMALKSTAHEASHIKRFKGLDSEAFYQQFADPLAPGESSKAYVRVLLNVVEDELVDRDAGGEIGQDAVNRVNRFYIWNRQGGTRKSCAELESDGTRGKCAAFIEALYQFCVHGSMLESYETARLAQAADEAAKARLLYGKGSLSRTQAMERVLTALRKYCPPPWSLPEAYEPPQGGSGGSGSGSDSPSCEGGEGSGTGEGQPGDQAGDGKGPGKGKAGSQSEGGNADGKGEGEGESSGKPSKGKPKGGKPGKVDGSKDESEEGSDADSTDTEESEGGGNGSPSETNSRGTESGADVGSPKTVTRDPERRFEDNNLEALLKMFERIIAERSEKPGRGIPRWKTWSPGEPVKDGDAICRYEEDETFGIDPLKRRITRRRDRERHLLAVFIDSSGSVADALFSQLYRVCGEIAEKVADLEGCYLGVGQFSGGASWVLEPTRDVVEIRTFAEETPQRLYSGGTTVGEIYGLLPEWFAGYESADLVVLTDGYVEDGKALAISLEKSHAETSCEIKLHGVVFRSKGSLKQFASAKDELPEFVRTWHLGDIE